MSLTLKQLNHLPDADFITALDGIYERSSWIVERTLAGRPFPTLAALKFALQQTVRSASAEEKLALIRAHPQLASKAAIGTLTRESAGEQTLAGLQNCSVEEFTILQKLNLEYETRFGFPFILAVRGPDGKGLSREAIIGTFSRRLRNPRDDEIAECLRQIGRIAEIRLNDLFDHRCISGMRILEQADRLAAWSDEETGLTCTYMTDAHQKVAAQLAEWMRETGMQVHIDAVGNVVGRYLSDRPDAKTLMTGSHYDTVRNGGKYDGRAGILIPIAVVRHLHDHGEKLPFHLEVIGFSEEEGVRFKSPFLGSRAMTGKFDPALLQTTDSNGVSLREALHGARHDPSRIIAIARDPAGLSGFVEIHIEQGPVLLEQDIPVGIVSSINGSIRYLITLKGIASHAGTTPMTMRRDAAAAAAEIVLLVERRCGLVPSVVGTVGQLQVPGGSVNVIPGTCVFSLDIRAPEDALRDAAVNDIVAGIDAICARRGIEAIVERTMNAAATPCASALKSQLVAAVERTGLPTVELPSGAGHDAMILAEMTGIAMLFIRCGNGGISHNPLETMTADDAELGAGIFLDFLRNFKESDATRTCTWKADQS